MKIFNFTKKKKNSFIQTGKARAEEAHSLELEIRTRIATLRRTANQMQRNAERARSEAYRLEVSGDHAGALSKAAEAANSEKLYKAAIDSRLSCERMYAQSKAQKAFTDLLNSCEEISMMVINQVDNEAAMEAQVRLQQTEVAMEQLQQEMMAVQEGFEPGTDPAICLAAGEEALAAIMAEYAPEPTRPVLEAPEAAEEEVDVSAIEERMVERRKLLAELA